MKHILFLASLSILLSGCGRGDKSNLTIQMPSGDFPKFESLSAMGAASSHWNEGLDPVGIAEVNCYGVVVNGPEAEMQRNYAVTDTGKKLHFGSWVAAVPAGGTVELVVPMGKNRTVYMLGFQANSTDSCRDFKQGAPDYDHLSRPYVIGKTVLNLEKKEERIELNVSMTGAFALVEFHGPGFGAPGIENGTFFFGDGRHGDHTISSPITNAAADTANLPGGRTFIPTNRVIAIDATGMTLNYANTWIAADLEPGDEIFWLVSGSHRAAAPKKGCGLLSDLVLGSYGFGKVANVALGSNELTLEAPITTLSHDSVALAETTFNGSATFCYISIYRVPQYDNLTIDNTASFSMPAFDFSPTSHGVFVLKVNNTLTLSGGDVSILANGRGYPGGAAGLGGVGSRGLAVLTNGRGNAGDGTSNTSEGGAGGSANGTGGNGVPAATVESGERYSLCSNALGDCPPGAKLLFGAGSGGSQNLAGVSGGGIIIIQARHIDFGGNNLNLFAHGAAGNTGTTGDGGSGGGAGGSVLLATRALLNSGASVLNVRANGGNGGAGVTGGNGGGGGGGGAIEVQSCEDPGGALGTFNATALGGTGGAGVAAGGSGENGNGPNPLNHAGNIGDYSIISDFICDIP